MAGLPGQFAHGISLLCRAICRETGRHYYEFVSTHASHVIILAAAVLKSLREQAQDTVALQVTKTVIDLLKTVHVADHHDER